ncbi:MAG TPA: FecR domain-containing protein [bacterium]|nr:FecR domain-containing protein [bacterium]
MKTLLKLSAVFLLLMAVGPLWAASTESGVLTQVAGKVQVKDRSGKKVRDAKDGSKVKEGERVVTAADSKTIVRFFDGSQLSVSPGSDVQMGEMRKLAGQDKVLHFKLLVGKLFASVQKLASSKSSFEIEAGGVVCGVRGTEYTLQYDPTTGKTNIQVLDGTVWVQSGGNTYTYGAGQGGSFTNGNPDKGNGTGNNGNGNQGKGGNDFNPFYGFNGNGGDDPGALLGDLSGGTGDVVGQTGDDGRNQTGRAGLVLQLDFPEYGNPLGGGGGGSPSVRGGGK